MADRDTSLYNLLGVGPDATWEQIHSRYKALRSVNHPDRGGSVDKFDDLKKAHDLLADRRLRAAYDAGEIGPDGKPARKSEEDEIKDIAKQGLVQMLSQLLELDSLIFPTLLQAIAKHDSDANLLIMKLRRNRNKLEARLKRSIVWKGGNEDLLSIIAKEKISAWEKQIEGCQRSLKIFAEGKRQALELQKQYEELTVVEPSSSLSSGIQSHNFCDGFDPEDVERMMRTAFGIDERGGPKPRPGDQGDTTTRRPGYSSSYGPQGRKR